VSLYEIHEEYMTKQLRNVGSTMSFTYMTIMSCYMQLFQPARE